MSEVGIGIAWFEAGRDIEQKFVEGFNLGQASSTIWVTHLVREEVWKRQQEPE